MPSSRMTTDKAQKNDSTHLIQKTRHHCISPYGIVSSRIMKILKIVISIYYL